LRGTAPFYRFVRYIAGRGRKREEAVHAVSINNCKPVRGRHTPRNDNGCIAVHAEYDRDDYVFLRAQTRQMQLMDWEGRMPPLKSWGGNIVANLAWEIFA
jgi:hypothetical protein